MYVLLVMSVHTYVGLLAYTACIYLDIWMSGTLLFDAHCLYILGYMEVWYTLVHSPMWWRRQMLFRWTEGSGWEGLGVGGGKM